MTPEEITAMQAQNAKLQADAAEAIKKQGEYQSQAEKLATEKADFEATQKKNQEEAEKKKLEEQGNYQEVLNKTTAELEKEKAEKEDYKTKFDGMFGKYKSQAETEYKTFFDSLKEDEKGVYETLVNKEDPDDILAKMPSLKKLRETKNAQGGNAGGSISGGNDGKAFSEDDYKKWKEGQFKK